MLQQSMFQEKADIYRDRVLAGENLSDIARSENIGRGEYIRQIIDRKYDYNDLVARRESKIILDIRMLAADGLSCAKIAEKLGMNYGQVRGRATKYKISCQGKRGVKKT